MISKYSSFLQIGTPATDGFAAVAYSVPGSGTSLDGKKIIAYRGTDNPSLATNPVKGASDILTGWIAALGEPTSQMNLAFEFYRQIIGGTTADPNVVVTGHSLGGGLAEAVSLVTGHSMGGGIAGYVAELFGVVASIFDPMPFVDGAANTYGRATAETVTAEGGMGVLADLDYCDRACGAESHDFSSER